MITLIGLGAGDLNTLSRGAEQALRDASDSSRPGPTSLCLRTARHPVVDALDAWCLTYRTFDNLYDTLPDFGAVYAAIADAVLEAAQLDSVAYAVPGHPLFAEESVRLIRMRARDLNIPIKIVSSGSFVEAALTAAGADLADGVDVRDALTLALIDTVDDTGRVPAKRPDTSRGLLLYQIYDTQSASHAKLCLMRDYPDEWAVTLIQAAGVAGAESIRSVPLFELDRQAVDHLTSVFVPPLPPALRRPGFEDLIGLTARLRAPGGCPWDREQTHQTLKPNFIEETYEVVDAIDSGDPDELCEELGDALLQVAFHAVLAAEVGDFNSDDVCSGIIEKLVRRHPHVFGDVDVADSREVLVNWENIKRSEKQDPGWRKSKLDGVPSQLPALMRAMEMSKKAVKVGFEWKCTEDVIAKVDEEVAELKAELARSPFNKEAASAEIGDLLFTVVQVARRLHIDAEEALRNMLKRFYARFRYMEERASKMGVELNDLSLEELDALWNEAKSGGHPAV